MAVQARDIRQLLARGLVPVAMKLAAALAAACASSEAGQAMEHQDGARV
jgi:hypothetical protein